ncbi:MAG: hypothetical protein JO031_09855 [Ktedonobacteraceae bacterium]|nr:hypothetical protein [Ktedonobacteraceae bacterium]
MVTPIVFIIIGIMTMAVVIYWSRGQRNGDNNLDDLVAQLRSVDVNAFRNLIDPEEEQFLRQRLPAWEFHTIHRARMLAAAEYVWGAARNAGLLMRLADAAKLDSDPVVVAAAENLLENAVRFRLYALRTLPQLYLGMLVPGMHGAPHSIAESYDSMTRQVVRLGCLQAPARGLSTNVG